MGHVDSSDLEKTLLQLEKRSVAAAAMYCETVAVVIQGKAMQKAPWTDRTGQARQRLKGSTEVMDDVIRIKLAHGVDYGVFLELAREKKHAILWPIIESESGAVIKGLSKLLDRYKLV